LVISNCVINLTIGQAKRSYREKCCSCIDVALIKEHYLSSIRKAGFQNVEVLSEQFYMDGYKMDGRKITSAVIKAVKI
jgi:arsenite methyltransferase